MTWTFLKKVWNKDLKICPCRRFQKHLRNKGLGKIK